MVWEGTSCPLAYGWQERLLSKTFSAGALENIREGPLCVCTSAKSLLHEFLRSDSTDQYGTAAGIGSVAGAVLAMLERKPLIPHMAGTAASAAICLSTYGGKPLPVLQAHDLMGFKPSWQLELGGSPHNNLAEEHCAA